MGCGGIKWSEVRDEYTADGPDPGSKRLLDKRQFRDRRKRCGLISPSGWVLKIASRHVRFIWMKK